MKQTERAAERNSWVSGQKTKTKIQPLESFPCIAIKSDHVQKTSMQNLLHVDASPSLQSTVDLHEETFLLDRNVYTFLARSGHHVIIS